MKKFLSAIAIAASIAMSPAAQAFDDSQGAAEMNFDALVELRQTLAMYDDALGQDYKRLQSECHDKSCLLVGLAQLYSQYFAIAGYDYDATVRAYIELIKSDPKQAPTVERAQMDGILFHLLVLARMPQFDAERKQLLKDGVLTQETIDAAQSLKI